MNYKVLLCKIIVLLLLYPANTYAYQEDDKTKDKKEYKRLRNSYFRNRTKDSIKLASAAIQEYILLAKENKDSSHIADGFYLLATIEKKEQAHKYCDSVILLTQKNHSTKHYPLLAYRKKAILYYYQYNFKKAFDYFLKVTEEAKKYNNELYYHQSIRDMVLIKAHVGEHETGMDALKKCYDYFSNRKDKSLGDYLETVFLLSDSYMRNKKLDSASVINKLGYEQSIASAKYQEWKYNFTLNEGINQYFKTNYRAAKDSLQKFINVFSDEKNQVNRANTGMAYFYLGKSLSASEEPEKALLAHKKVDEIFQDGQMTIPEIRYSYDVLMNHYKRIGDKDNHLKYIEKRLAVDSILKSDYKYLIKNVVQKYDTPRLLSEKQEIIDSLENENKSSTLISLVMIILSVVFFAFWISNYLKRRNYKQKFLELYDSTSNGIENKAISPDQNEIIDIGVSNETIEDILEKLNTFEQNLDFLKSNITTGTLSKKFNTNSKYLSKVVNRYKHKSFSTYINDLRIDYSVERLKKDEKFQRYTMAAIAREIGFNTSQAFSKSFFKKNGIHPSYFIKQLEKQKSA